jgi:hypothetical protein
MLVEEARGCSAVSGYDRCIVNLAFDHVDPRPEVVSDVGEDSKSIAAFRAEAKKCVLVCADCHGEIEAGLIKCPPAGAKYRHRRKARAA